MAIPKALVEIGGRPILWHVIRIYAAQGVRRVLLLTGYLGEQIAEYVATRPWADHAVEVDAIDTGLDTMTGGRIKRTEREIDGAPFCATYADGVADIDLGALAAHHRDGGTLATMTVVRPRAAVRRRRARRRRPRARLPREAPVRALDQRRLLLLRARGLRVHPRRQRARARATRGPGS